MPLPSQNPPGIDYYLVSPGGRARRLLPSRGTYVMGREEGVDIVVHDALISRRHALFQWQVIDSGWILVDNNSRNGVYVQGERIDGQRLLADGDTIQLGGHVFNFGLVPANSDANFLRQQAPNLQTAGTLAPGMGSLADMAKASAAFSGPVGDGGVLELIQFFMHTRKTGRLDLLGHRGASIHVVSGRPVHAQLGSQTGMPALVALAQDPGDEFAFFDGETPAVAPTISGSADSTLMDLARQLDESGR
jgi:hypothetical protein